MFRDVNFRYTDGQEEKIHAPELIDKAFVDIDNVLNEIDRPEKFIVVGPKGSGKSALSSKLQMRGVSEWDLFVAADELEQFEFNLLDKTGADKGTSIGGAVTVWQMLLSIRLLPLLISDEMLASKNSQLIAFHASLIKYGLASSDSLIKIVQYTSRRGIFSSIKSAISEVRGEAVEEEQFKVKDPAAVLESIKNVFATVKPADSRYYLVIDGLDHPIRSGRSNAHYLSDLINAARLLNNFFNELGLLAKVIILIRNEVLSFVPEPNKTKRVYDNGIALKWYDNTRSPFATGLFEVIEKRAALAGFSDSIDVLWGKWFPPSIHGKDSVTFVLDNTRYLPRDLISFFREIQGLRKDPPFTQDDVLSALSNYSDWYFDELCDGLVGLISEEIRMELTSVLSELGRTFKFKDLSALLIEVGAKDEAEALTIAKEMFNTSWIGNVSKDDKDKERYSWRHRKKNAVFNQRQEIRLHPGLWKTLNLI